MASHTATGEWKSFEIRMRRRRAERLIVRAGADIEAGNLEGARAMLAEARALWPGAPGLRTLEERIANGHVLAVPEIHPSRWKEAAAAVAIVVFTGAAVTVVLTKGAGVLAARQARAAVVSAPDARAGVLPARDAHAGVLPARDARAIVEPAAIVARAPITLYDEAQSVEPERADSDEPARLAAPVQRAEVAPLPGSADSTSPPPGIIAPKTEAPRPNLSVAPPD